MRYSARQNATTSPSIPPPPTITTPTVRPTRAPAAIDDLRARVFLPEDFYLFDEILVADHSHYRHLSAIAPDDDACAKIGFMLDTLPDNPGAELPDPYYGEAADFERTFTLLEAALRARFA